MNLKSFRKPAIILLSVAGSLLLLFFIFRNPVMHWATAKVITRIKIRTGADVTIRDSHFRGFTTIRFTGISVKPMEGDTIFTADVVEARLSVWMLLSATIRLKQLYANNVRIFISCNSKGCNYESLIHHNSAETAEGTGDRRAARDYSSLMRRMLDNIFNLTPQKALLTDVYFHFKNDSIDRTVVLEKFTSDVNSLHGNFVEKKSGAGWEINGTFSQSSRNLTVKISSPESGFVPVIRELTGASVSFKSMTIGLSGYGRSGSEETMTGQFSTEDYSFHHARFSEDTIRIPAASFYFSLRAGKNYIEMDSTSKASLGSITFVPFARYESAHGKNYSLKLATDKIPSSSFFSSLPEGIFDEVREIEADGSLQYKLDFSINSEMPDSVRFESSLKKERFRIRKFGNSNLMKMNGEFIQNVYEKNRLVRSFPVGESNPAYTTLDKISPNFINAVLTSEDGNFFYHNGFNEEAFRKSIAVNFKAGKFVRGGSTISMQLVKNVFLTRKKTIARKAEEALLVWLIESNRLYSKERMLEVYMNIIELGPGIYGIGEAAPFYFNKLPADLTLPEGIFLASLLPHPKWFKYSFDTLGNLKPYLADYYRIVSDFMLRKELITQEQHDELTPHVTLLGPAREMVIPSDTIPKDDEENNEE